LFPFHTSVNLTIGFGFPSGNQVAGDVHDGGDDMTSSKTLLTVSFGMLLGAMVTGLVQHSAAQPPQIPSTPASNKTVATVSDNGAIVAVSGQMAPAPNAASGKIQVLKFKASYDPASDTYPSLNLVMRLDLAESPKSIVTAETVDHMTSYGRLTPTTVFCGRCNLKTGDQKAVSGYQYWVLIANNTKEPSDKHTPDILSFVITEKGGKRIAYGTGVVTEGDLHVEPTLN